MNKIRLINYLLALCPLLLLSCEKEFLNKTPDEDLSIEDVFAQRQYAQQFLTNVYTSIPDEFNMRDNAGRNPFVGATDEMETTWLGGVYQNAMNSGAWNSSDEPGMWRPVWVGIRNANVFLEHVDNIPLSDIFTLEEREHWKGEALFLRAFYHFLSMRCYGPIPIVDSPMPLDTDFNTIRRQPIQDVVDFVVQDCDRAISLLPMRLENPSVDLGRATAAAALALKARVLLYMASPLWNGLTADGVPDPTLANFTDHDGVKLFPQTLNPARWEQAAAAAKACIDEAEAAGYGLFRAADNDPVNNYAELFLQNHNREVLFAKNVFEARLFENQVTPNGMGGTSGSAPTQDLVDAYEMQATGESPIIGYRENGSPIINPASGYVEAGYTSGPHPNLYYRINTRNMYVGRDPRFYASINFNGQYWRTRRIEFWRSGLDGLNRSTTNFTKTGYLMRKGSSPSVNIPQGIFNTKTWIFFRLGEQYLNYAEARNESLGAPDQEVYEYVNRIRERAGMPALPEGLSKEEMRERIRHERRIELAFETHRYFDLHRWRLAEIIDNAEVHGLNYQAPGPNSFTSDAFYQRQVIEKRVFESPKHYFWPIPQPEIQRNPGLVQNPGW